MQGRVRETPGIAGLKREETGAGTGNSRDGGGTAWIEGSPLERCLETNRLGPSPETLRRRCYPTVGRLKASSTNQPRRQVSRRPTA